MQRWRSMARRKPFQSGEKVMSERDDERLTVDSGSTKQIPCIERCAFGAVKAWTAYAIASNEVASSHRVSLDQTIMALAETAKDMNSKYKETSEAGLALSVTLC
jgi:Serine dehydratase alpha chain